MGERETEYAGPTGMIPRGYPFGNLATRTNPSASPRARGTTHDHPQQIGMSTMSTLHCDILSWDTNESLVAGNRFGCFKSH